MHLSGSEILGENSSNPIVCMCIGRRKRVCSTLRLLTAPLLPPPHLSVTGYRIPREGCLVCSILPPSNDPESSMRINRYSLLLCTLETSSRTENKNGSHSNSNQLPMAYAVVVVRVENYRLCHRLRIVCHTWWPIFGVFFRKSAISAH